MGIVVIFIGFFLLEVHANKLPAFSTWEGKGHANQSTDHNQLGGTPAICSNISKCSEFQRKQTASKGGIKIKGAPVKVKFLPSFPNNYPFLSLVTSHEYNTYNTAPFSLDRHKLICASRQCAIIAYSQIPTTKIGELENGELVVERKKIKREGKDGASVAQKKSRRRRDGGKRRKG